MLKEVPLVEGSKPVQKYHWKYTVGCIASWGGFACLSFIFKIGRKRDLDSWSMGRINPVNWENLVKQYWDIGTSDFAFSPSHCILYFVNVSYILRIYFLNVFCIF